MADLSDTQWLALTRETEDSVFLIHEGLLALNSLGGANDFFHGPLGLLAQGYERLMKLVVCLSQLEHEGALPSKKQMREKYGHEWKEKLGAGEFAGFYDIENAELTSTFQRFARALCRMFTLGPLGDRGRRLQPLVRVFLSLRDKDLDSAPKRWFEPRRPR